MRMHSAPTFALAVAILATAACSGANSLTGPASQDGAALTANAGAGGSGSSGSSTASSNTNRIRVFAALTPPAGGTFRRASGKAKWDSRCNNAQRELEMEVEDLATGTAVNFFVDGTQYGGTVVVDAYGQVHLNLSTQLGHTVPSAVAGLRAEARTTAGVVIVTGMFP